MSDKNHPPEPPPGEPPPGEPPPGEDGYDVKPLTLPAKFNLNNADSKSIDTAPPGSPMDEKDKAGVDLAKIVLFIISGVIIFSFGLIIYYEQIYSISPILISEIDKMAASTNLSVEDLERVSNSLARIETYELELQREYREHWLNFVRLILLNLLLPVLTAILGYVFGSNNANKNEPS